MGLTFLQIKIHTLYNVCRKLQLYFIFALQSVLVNIDNRKYRQGRLPPSADHFALPRGAVDSLFTPNRLGSRSASPVCAWWDVAADMLKLSLSEAGQVARQYDHCRGIVSSSTDYWLSLLDRLSCFYAVSRSSRLFVLRGLVDIRHRTFILYIIERLHWVGCRRPRASEGELV